MFVPLTCSYVFNKAVMKANNSAMQHCHNVSAQFVQLIIIIINNLASATSWLQNVIENERVQTSLEIQVQPDDSELQLSAGPESGLNRDGTSSTMQSNLSLQITIV